MLGGSSSGGATALRHDELQDGGDHPPSILGPQVQLGALNLYEVRMELELRGEMYGQVKMENKQLMN